MSTLRLIALCGWIAAATPLAAEPVTYALDTANSQVGFQVMFGADPITGTIPVAGAEVVLDFDRNANSRVFVEMNTAGAQASFPFATQAMRGPKVLDSATHPMMSFRSLELRADGEKAKVTGELTLRGITRPVTLEAQLFRQQGTEAGDLSRLSVLLTGSLRRSDFGATGWDDMVSDEVALIIRIRIERAG